PDEVKAQYIASNLRSSIVTRAIDGAPQRVLQTALVKRLERSGPISRFFGALKNAWMFRKITGQPFFETLREARAMKKTRGLSFAELSMAANAPMLTRATMVDGNLDAGILPTGQIAGAIAQLPTVAELIEEIVRDAETQ